MGMAVFAGIVLLGGVVTFAFLPKIKAAIAQASKEQSKEEEEPAPAVKKSPKSKPNTPTSNPKDKPKGEKPTPRKPNDKKETKPKPNPKPKKDPPTPTDPTDPGPKPKPKPKPKPPVEKPIPSGQFPRRALIISVHNYLYANPLVDPSVPGSQTAITRLKRSLDGLRVPQTQIFRLSDLGENPHPPLKPVIEQGLANFLKTTRKQDRIIVFFLGHTKEIDNEAYLVPLEGELDDARTLIPLKWVFDQLAKCECRQKILVLDGNRFNPAQGEERPTSGPMGSKFELALKSPPPGVQVWSACAANQQSNEFEEAPLGVFLDSFRREIAPEGRTKGALTGKIQKADDLIPLAVLNRAVNKRMGDSLERRKLTQKSFISGNAPLDGVAFDKSEAPAVSPSMPEVKTTDQKVVKDILSEISLPPLKGNAGVSEDVTFDILPPFSPDALKAYDGELKSDSKLRQAIHEARVALWAIARSTPPRELEGDVMALRNKLKFDLSIMQDRYTKPGPGRAEMVFKDKVFEDSKKMSRIVAELEDVLDRLKEAGKEKDAAPKRWQANYAIILARFQAQLVYLEEYQGLLGQMRKEFPPHDPAIHNGWKMAAKEKASDSAAKKYDKVARKLYAELAKSHRGTPWEVLAKREKLTALGLEWQPY
jgi:hypothetical protein